MIATPTTTRARVAEIARLQREAAALVDEAARRYFALQVEIQAHADEMTRDLRRRNPSMDARALVAALAAEQVNVGELDGRFSDAIEARAHAPVYPHAYTPIRAKWALVENRG